MGAQRREKVLIQGVRKYFMEKMSMYAPWEGAKFLKVVVLGWGEMMLATLRGYEQQFVYSEIFIKPLLCIR